MKRQKKLNMDIEYINHVNNTDLVCILYGTKWLQKMEYLRNEGQYGLHE